MGYSGQSTHPFHQARKLSSEEDDVKLLMAVGLVQALPHLVLMFLLVVELFSDKHVGTLNEANGMMKKVQHQICCLL